MTARSMVGRLCVHPIAMTVLATALAGCAGPSLVLLDDEHGGNGAVAVLETNGSAGETVVATSNTRTRLGRANPVSRPLGDGGLKDDEQALVESLPPEALRFIIYFIEGTTRPAPGSENVIEAVRGYLPFRPGAEIQVTGHTDTVGSDDDNDRLSQKRAMSVATALVEQGFDPEMLSAVGRGERELIVPTGDNVANADNRRVEIIVR